MYVRILSPVAINAIIDALVRMPARNGVQNREKYARTIKGNYRRSRRVEVRGRVSFHNRYLFTRLLPARICELLILTRSQL